MAMTVDWTKAILAEHAVADIIATQERRGVWFDTQRAKWYIHILTERILRIDQVAVPQMPKVLSVTGNLSKPFKKNGGASVALEKWLDRTGEPLDNIGGPFTAISFEPFDFGKVGLFKDWMIKNGWVPDQWNLKDVTLTPGGGKIDPQDQARLLNAYIKDLQESPSGDLRIKILGIKKGSTIRQVKDLLIKRRKIPTTPKITETSLETIDTPLGKMIMERMVWSHRRSLIEGLVKLVRDDHRISAGANPCATPTARMRHSRVVNIPAARSPFGKEIRSLFGGGPLPDGERCPAEVIRKGLPEGTRVRPLTNILEILKKGEWRPVGEFRCYLPPNRYRFVGYDGAGLELRMFANRLGDPEYINEVVNGDVHTKNQLAAGLPTRDDAKTFIYAFLYGAGDAKIGLIVGGTSRDGARLRAQFLEANPKLAALIESVREQAERGYVVGIDGRKLWMRRDENGRVMAHKALNTILQGDGAIVMKYAMIHLDEQVKDARLRAHKVIDMHDEGQWECHPEDVDKLRAIMDNCVRIAGEELGLLCPLASDSVVGRNWYETH